MSRLRALLMLIPVVSGLAQIPSVNPGGVVDAASFGKASVGSLVSIFGSGLALQPVSASNIPLPVLLGGVSVKFNGIAAPLLYVSPGQINAQLPWEMAAGNAASVVVTNNGRTSAPLAFTESAFSPGAYLQNGQAVAVNLDGTPVASQPARPGDTISIFVSGLGPTNPPAVTGANSIDLLRRTSATPSVLLNGATVAVTFAGLSPQFVGVYQLNVVVPQGTPPAASAPLQIEVGGLTSAATTSLSIGAGWPQWGGNSQHAGAIGVAGQDLSSMLADIVYDPLAQDEQAANHGDLLVHYQVPLADGNDVYMESKSGTYDPAGFASQSWGESKFSWTGNTLAPVWTYASDWKAPGSSNDFWEPVFHAALGNDVLYVPGASGSLIEVNKFTGTAVRRFSPFGADPNTYETGPITVDLQGNVLYNAIQVKVDPVNGFYANDAADSWLVKVAPGGSVSIVSYKALTASEAPAPGDQCLTTFKTSELPWPPDPGAIPAAANCGTQRVGLNVAPAVASDGTIYSVTRAHFNERYGFLVAINPDLSKKWAVSLRDRLHDGCGVAVAEGGWLPSNGAPGGCKSGAPVGVDPATNRAGAGRVVDGSSSSPAVAPDGSVLYGAYTRYNYSQGHLLHFDMNGNYLGAFGFGWDITPAIYSHDGTWSAVLKDNHYAQGSYCADSTLCPDDRTATNPASPEEYLIAQLSPDLTVEWTHRNTNTESCARNADKSVTCVSDHPAGFEWCVNAPAVDKNGVVYANSEDGNIYAIAQGGQNAHRLFQQLALGAAYTPASIGGDGRVYTQNEGHLFAAGK